MLLKLEEYSSFLICQHTDKSNSLFLVSLATLDATSITPQATIIDDSGVLYKGVFNNQADFSHSVKKIKSFLVKNDGKFDPDAFSIYIGAQQQVATPPTAVTTPPQPATTPADNIEETLISLSKKGDFKKVISLAQTNKSLDVNTVISDIRGYGVLDFAILSNASQDFRGLISAGFSSMSPSIWSDLYIKHKDGAKSIILELLGAKLDLSVCSEYMSKAIIGERDFDMLNILLTIEDNHLSEYTLKSIFEIAIEFNKLETITTLLELGLLPSKECMATVIKIGAIDTLKMLVLEIGYPIKNHPELLSDATASVVGEEVIDLLLTNGISPNYVNNDDVTAITTCAAVGRPEYFQKIISVFTDLINSVDESGRSALMLAVIRNYKKMVLEILSHSPQLDLFDSKGNSVVFYVAKHSTKDMMSLLIDSGADINMKNSKGTTALMSMCLTKDMEAISLLISSGADPLLTNNNGMSALAAALIQKSDAHLIVRLLLESGSNPNEEITIDGKTYTPTELANHKNKLQSSRVISDYI